MDRKKSVYLIKNNWPIIAFVIWIFLMHFVLQLGYGDDVYFKNCLNIENMSLLEWARFRYMEWSSRSLIEISEVIISGLPGWVWRIADATILSLTLIIMSYFFVEKENKLFGNLVLAALFFSVDYEQMVSAGWISTTLNYIWPFFMGLMALLPLKKRMKKQSVSTFQYVICVFAAICAAFCEQITALLTLMIVGYIIYQIYHKNTELCYEIIVLLIQICGIINVVLCPGNDSRVLQETPRWFPEFANYSFLQKISIGISSTLRFLFSDTHSYAFIVFAFALMLAILFQKKSVLEKMFGIIPVVFICYTHIFSIINTEFSSFWEVNDMNTSVIRGEVKLEYCLLLVLAYITCFLIIINIFSLFGKDEKALLVTGMYILGLAGKAMLGFSPTIWASYPRTGWISHFLFMGCAVLCILQLKNNKKMVVIISILLVFLAFYGCDYNYASVFSVIRV